MGVWELVFLDNEVKKYLKLSLDEGFDEEQGAKFGVIAIQAKEQLEMLKAQWEVNAKDGKERGSMKGLTCPGCGEIGTLRKIIYGMPDPETFDFEKYAVRGCCINGDGSEPNISCKVCDWSDKRDSLEEK